jgi:tRNA A-37 threonylcarbamoyl transferase component Bud32
MVLFLDISSFVNTIDKEIENLEKKTNETINELYKKNIIVDENKMVLYNSFRKYYNNKIFIDNIISILDKHKLSLHISLYKNEIDYIKNFGYNKIKIIGSGYYGTTYSCYKNSKKYAIKLQKYNYEYGTLETFINSIVSEYNKLNKLNKTECHFFVPKVYDIIFIFNESISSLYSIIIMEFINGITLKKYIDQKGKLSITDKNKLDSNLNKLHKFGIFHRDLHNENIMVVKKGKTYNFIFIDFGSSKTKKNLKNNSLKIISNNIIKEKYKLIYISINNFITNKMISLIFSIIKIIDKEIILLEKKTEKEIDTLYKDEYTIFLYNFLEEYYTNKIFIKNVKSILDVYKQKLHVLVLPNEMDYIKKLGYNNITKLEEGYVFNKEFYICHKNNKEYEFIFKKFNPDNNELTYNDIYLFLQKSIDEYNNLKKINDIDSNLSVKVYNIYFIINKLTNQLYSVIVMKYVKGITLDKYIHKNGKLSDDDKKKIINNITKLHKFGLYNIIIKEKNILVVKNGKTHDFIFTNLGEYTTITHINNAKFGNKERLHSHYKENSSNNINKKLYISINNLINNQMIDIIL